MATKRKSNTTTKSATAKKSKSAAAPTKKSSGFKWSPSGFGDADDWKIQLGRVDRPAQLLEVYHGGIGESESETAAVIILRDQDSIEQLMEMESKFTDLAAGKDVISLVKRHVSPTLKDEQSADGGEDAEDGEEAKKIVDWIAVRVKLSKNPKHYDAGEEGDDAVTFEQLACGSLIVGMAKATPWKNGDGVGLSLHVHPFKYIGQAKEEELVSDDAKKTDWL